MLASIMAVIAYAAAAGAAASWLVGAVLYARTLSRSNERWGSGWLLVPVWPLAASRLPESKSQSEFLNKALVALLAFVLVAATAYAVSANLQRLSR